MKKENTESLTIIAEDFIKILEQRFNSMGIQDTKIDIFKFTPEKLYIKGSIVSLENSIKRAPLLVHIDRTTKTDKSENILQFNKGM